MFDPLQDLPQRTVDILRPYLGRTVTRAFFRGDALTLYFGQQGVRMYDDGQCCCEHRYTVCDDDPACLVGGELMRVVQRDVEIKEEWGICTEIQFIEVETTTGSVTLRNHNEHNGYYGGFILCAIPAYEPTQGT